MMPVWMCDQANSMFASLEKHVSKVAHTELKGKSIFQPCTRSFTVMLAKLIWLDLSVCKNYR